MDQEIVRRNELIYCFTLPLVDAWSTVVNASSTGNEVESFHKRYLKRTPEPSWNKIDWDLVRRICDDLIMKIRSKGVEAFSLDDFLASKKGKLGMRYRKAYHDLKNNGFTESVSSVGAFIKNERYYEDKPPRFIMGRNPQFNILYAKYVQPFEKAFFELDEVANACNFVSCGDKFAKMVSEMDSFDENDMSKYESSQRHVMLALEHYIMRESLRGSQGFDEEEFDKLFALKCIKNGQTPNGVKFKFAWCRGSGDMDTSTGNGVLNYITSVYTWLLNHCDADHYKRGCKCNPSIILKGDDSILGNPTGKPIVDYYKLFGFDAKIIHRANWWDVEFCSGKYLRNGRSFIYVQGLKKLLSSVQTIINPDFFHRSSDYYYSLGKMYSVVYRGIPIYEDLGRFLMSCGGKQIAIPESELSYSLSEALKLKEAFKAESDHDSLLLDITMTSGLSMAELMLIRQYLQDRVLLLPPILDRPTRVQKTKEQPPLTTLDFHVKIYLNKETTAIYHYLANGRVWSTKRGTDPLNKVYKK